MTVDLSPRRISFGSLGFFSRLFRQYCDGFQRLEEFYAHDYRHRSGRARAADVAAAHPRDRLRLVEVLREQNAQWGLDTRTRDNIDLLLQENSVAVVTGQQVGIFGGPLYTVYKTISVLQLADQLASETGRPVVPVFWLEGEDHDFQEISSVSLLARNEPVRLSYADPATPEDGNRGPVGRLRFAATIDDAVRALDEALPPTDFKEQVMGIVREAYRPGATPLDAFARLMRKIFADTGLVFISSDDARLKRQLLPLFRREIEETHEVSRKVEKAGARLRGEYHAQVGARPSNLFYIDDDGRHPLDAEGDGFRLRGRDRTFSASEIRAELEDHPESFSANVVLRPLVQDTLLPTALYVGGPSEVAYFAQLKDVYAWAGVPMPAIYPRASATLVESKIQKVLDEYQLTIGELNEDLDALFQRVVRERVQVDIDAQFETAGRYLDQSVNHLRPLLEAVDRTLLKSAEATRASMLKEFDKLRHRVLKAEKRQHEQVRGQLEKAARNLFPVGKPQERSLSVIYFLNKYGLDFTKALRQGLSTDTGCHQVLVV